MPYSPYLLLHILYTEGIAGVAAERVIEAILTHHDTNAIVTDPGRPTAQLFVEHLHERSKELLSSSRTTASQ